MNVTVLKRINRKYQIPFIVVCDEFSFHSINHEFSYLKDGEFFLEDHVVDIYVKGGSGRESK